jgi:hypothetical protein
MGLRGISHEPGSAVGLTAGGGGNGFQRAGAPEGLSREGRVSRRKNSHRTSLPPLIPGRSSDNSPRLSDFAQTPGLLYSSHTGQTPSDLGLASHRCPEDVSVSKQEKCLFLVEKVPNVTYQGELFFSFLISKMCSPTTTKSCSTDLWFCLSWFYSLAAQAKTLGSGCP